jgi:hypothetical protein
MMSAELPRRFPKRAAATAYGAAGANKQREFRICL